MGLAPVFILLLTGLSLALSVLAIRRDIPPEWRFEVAAPMPAGGAARLETVFDYTAPTGQAHSPSILPRGEGFDILWFEGSQEAQADVDIHHAAFRPDSTGWTKTAQGALITRDALGRVMQPRQLVVTLGNTVAHEAEEGRVLATVVSVGGWAMASVADVRLEGDRPVAARKLNLSPFLNRSHLVKSPMVPFADGGYGLPAYFEMGATHGALVRMDARGRVRDVARIDGPGKPIQPMIVPLNESRAVAFLRDFEPSGRLLISRTEDGGQSWSRAVFTDLPNPSAPVAALSLGGGRILMAANDDPDGRDRLSLLLSTDEGASWRPLRVIEENGAGARYAVMRPLPGGEIVLAYSMGAKTGVRVHVMTPAWAGVE